MIALGFAPPAQASEELGVIATVKGSVSVTHPGASEKRATRGERVFRGSKIRTGSGQAELRLDDGSMMRVRSNSSIMLSPTARKRKKKASVLLFFGRVWSKVSRSVTGDSNYEVSTPTAVAGVRGTEFETAVGADGSVRVDVQEGAVAVADGDDAATVAAGERVDGDTGGLGDKEQTTGASNWVDWQKQRSTRVKSEAPQVLDTMRSRITARKSRLEALRAKQKDLKERRSQAERRLNSGDRRAADEIRGYNDELARIADEIADIGDQATSQFGYVDHLADLASDPRFGMIDRKTLAANARELRALKKDFDAMVKEGTDISEKAMDKMLDDMGSGKSKSLDDDSVKDFFGEDPF